MYRRTQTLCSVAQAKISEGLEEGLATEGSPIRYF
jgi:hypothetical protein